MNDKPEAVEQFKLDTLTKSTRFLASMGPRCATRISLGVCLGVEDSLTDPQGELLGIKLHQGASALASGIGSIASSVREGVRSKATQLGSDAGALPAVPSIEKAKGFLSQAATEVRDSWASAGYIAVQVEQPQPQESDEPAASLAGDALSSSAVDTNEEVI
jgi:hypothetical protein